MHDEDWRVKDPLGLTGKDHWIGESTEEDLSKVVEKAPYTGSIANDPLARGFTRF